MSKKHLIIAVKILIFLAVCGWGGKELYRSWNTIQQIAWQPNYWAFALAGLCYAVAYIPAAVFWRYTMQSLGQNPGLYESFRAYYIGHLGKYVPGKAMVLILRSCLLNHEKTKVSAAAASVFLETMTMMAAGAFAAAVMLVIRFHQTEHSGWLTLLAIGIVAGTMLPILPPVFHFAAKKCNIELEGLTFRTLAVGWLLNIPVWMMLGVSLWFTLLGFGIKDASFLAELPFCTLAIAFSMVLGFVSMIPGGLGVREFAMARVLTPFFEIHSVGIADPAVQAFVVVAVQRIISILSEAVVSILFWKK